MSVKPPSRRHYRPGTQPVPHQELPFAALVPGRPRVHCWQVPPADDYHKAYRIGREFAGHYIQYLQDNPNNLGNILLGRIAGDVDFEVGREQGLLGRLLRADRASAAVPDRHLRLHRPSQHSGGRAARDDGQTSGK